MSSVYLSHFLYFFLCLSRSFLSCFFPTTFFHREKQFHPRPTKLKGSYLIIILALKPIHFRIPAINKTTYIDEPSKNKHEGSFLFGFVLILGISTFIVSIKTWQVSFNSFRYVMDTSVIHV